MKGRLRLHHPPALRLRDGSALLSALSRSHCPCIAIRWSRKSHGCRQHGRTGSSALWLSRSHCPCIAIRWSRKSHGCRQHGRTGSSALWLSRSHCRGIGSQKGRRFHYFPLLGTSGSSELEESGVNELLLRPKHDPSSFA